MYIYKYNEWDFADFDSVLNTIGIVYRIQQLQKEKFRVSKNCESKTKKQQSTIK